MFSLLILITGEGLPYWEFYNILTPTTIFIGVIQIQQMPSLVFYLDSPQWVWHYDPALDSLYAVGYSQVRVYVFFARSFSTSVFTADFDPTFPYDGVPLHMAHPVIFDIPHAPPAPPLADAPSSSSSSDSDPSEGPDAPSGGEAIMPMANGFA